MIVTKKILPARKYKVVSNHGRISRDFTEEYLNRVASVSNKMLESGLRIPAPFDHHKEAKPRTKEEEDEIQLNQSASAYNNAGYWKKFWVAPDDKTGVPTLYGQLDAPGDLTDANSPAYKISKVNEEVSVSINNNFEDGLGRTWTDGLMHVAIVNHAVVPNQEPFKEAPDGVTVVNMSMLEPGSDNESLVDELKTVLRKIKIILPSSTDSSTFLRDLLVAASQIPDSNVDTLEPAPIYMSIGDEEVSLTEAQAKALVDAKTVNPATSQPFTMEDLGFKKKVDDNKDILASLADKDNTIKSLQSIASAFKNKFIQDAKTNVQKRISSLIEAGVITKEYADANLVPKVEFQMSIVDGNIQDHPLEVTLSAIEAIAPKKDTPNGFPSNATVQPQDLGADIDLTDDQISKALDELNKDGLL